MRTTFPIIDIPLTFYNLYRTPTVRMQIQSSMSLPRRSNVKANTTQTHTQTTYMIEFFGMTYLYLSILNRIELD